MSATYINKDRTVDKMSPTTSELEHLLAERALWRQTQARLGTGILLFAILIRLVFGSLMRFL